MAAVKSFVDTLIANNKVVVFSKSYCGNSINAKSVLATQNIPADSLKLIDIDGNPDMEYIQDYLKELTGDRTVPRVFIGGQFFGGNAETTAGAENGKLTAALKAAGAIHSETVSIINRRASIMSN